MRTVKITIVILICAALLGGCGLKGPLYLPEEDPVTEPVSATEQQDEDGEDEDKGGNNISPD